MNDEIKFSFEKLESWIARNGLSGFDPYDIKANKFVLILTKLGNKSRIAEVVREFLFELFLLFPILSRKIMKIKPTYNAKGIAILASAYLDLFQLTKKQNYFNLAQKCIEWLDINAVSINSGIGWGYPFDWQTKILIPAFTPNGIVTTAVGDVYWKLYNQTSNEKYLDRCVDICRFLSSLPIDKINEEQICFSYTPLFINHVHNLNLFVAEYLIKIAKEINKIDWIELGLKAVNYTIANQLYDGSFDYDGYPEKLRNFRDNYHTGFVLRMLFSIWKLTNDDKIFNSLYKCYIHYINNFFVDNTIPKFKPETLYRIDIHSCSESIICLSQLSSIFNNSKAIAKNVLLWTINALQDVDGYFYHGIFKSRFGFRFKSKIPYLRWGEAWMLKAFAEYFKIET